MMADSSSTFDGRLSDLSCFQGTGLYVATGVPQVFRQVTQDGRDCQGDSWVYIPHRQLMAIQKTTAAEIGSPYAACIAGSAIEIDSENIYPVLMHGQILGLLSTTCQAPLRWNRKLADSVQSVFASHDILPISRDQNAAGQFVDKLFERDRGADDFLIAMLHLLTDQWVGTLGAVYCEMGGVYRLRLAVGNIERCDSLRHSVMPDAVGEWMAAIRDKSYFVPAEVLPDYPCTLAHPPKFTFVHPSMRSHRTEYLIVLCLSADIDRNAASAMREIAGLSCRLHESQFSTAAQTVRLYGRLDMAAKSALALDDILLESFKVLSRQLEVSRMVVTRDAGSAKIVSARVFEEPIVRDVDDMPICLSAAGFPGDGGPRLYSDVQSEFAGSPEAESYRLDGVKSELQFPITLPGVDGVVAFGSPLGGGYLLTGKDFLAAVAQLVGLNIMLSEAAMVPTNASLTQTPEQSADKGLQRFGTIHKLAGGHFHQLISLLSVVIGQVEIIGGEFCSSDDGDMTPGQQSGMDKIAHAADQMADVLPLLRDLCMLDDENLQREIPCHQMMTELPILLRGYIRQMADTKNISVRVETVIASGADFTLRYVDICDCILPLLLTTMDEAICSGIVTVEARMDRTGGSLVLTFDRAMIGHTGLGELLTRAYDHRLYRVHGEEAGEVKIGSFVIGFGSAEGEKCRLHMVKDTPLAQDSSQLEKAVAVMHPEGD